MMMSHVIRNQLVMYDLRSGAPPALVLLHDLYGISNQDIANMLKRSPNQVTYYRSGFTKIPPEVNSRLQEMLIGARRVARSAETKLANPLRRAIIALTTHVIDNYEELHAPFSKVR